MSLAVAVTESGAFAQVGPDQTLLNQLRCQQFTLSIHSLKNCFLPFAFPSSFFSTCSSYASSKEG